MSCFAPILTIGEGMGGLLGDFYSAIFIKHHHPKTTQIHTFRQLGREWGAFYGPKCGIFASFCGSISKWGEGGVFLSNLCNLTIMGANGGHFVLFLHRFGVILGVKMQIGGSGG